MHPSRPLQDPIDSSVLKLKSWCCNCVCVCVCVCVSTQQREPKELEGALRPGCLMLTVDCVMPSYVDYTAALESFKLSFEGSLSAGGSLWATHDTDIRLPDSLIQVPISSLPAVL